LVQKWRGKYVFRRWPRRGGPIDARLRNWQRDQFGLAAQMAANPWPIDYWTAVEVVKGAQMVPRDFLMMCIYGKGYVVEGPDGEQWTVADHGPPPIPEEVIVALNQANPLGWPGTALSWASTASIGFNFLRLKPVVITADMIITGIQLGVLSAAATAHLTPVIYDHLGGVPTNLLASGSTVVGATAGINSLPLSSPYTPSSAIMAWIGFIHTIANITVPSVSIGNYAFKSTSSDTPQNPLTGVSIGSAQAGFWGY
jgi:hypothetical protein